MPSSSATAYGGSAGGWVLERFLRQRRYLPTISLAAEDSDVITATVTLTTFQEALNDYVTADEAITCECELLAADDMKLADDGGTEAKLSDGGTGTIVGADDQARLIMTSTSAGVFTVDVTDDASASSATFYLKVTPLNVPGFSAYIAVTFDGS
tara:strand:+ start:52 stop:513 length:462 start_codon:yes stop_codon:yes gene_type:complete